MLKSANFSKSKAIIKLNIARTVENSIACSFINVFFSTIAASEVKKAHPNAKIYHLILNTLICF
ncbi:MAG: hypothetical protein K0B02_00515 [DPANN group archaeon]|nr:hypothetical protein [DPANN group archaeon]